MTRGRIAASTSSQTRTPTRAVRRAATVTSANASNARTLSGNIRGAAASSGRRPAPDTTRTMTKKLISAASSAAGLIRATISMRTLRIVTMSRPARSAPPSGSIVIDTSRRKLYYVTGPTSALAYPIGVGRDGFSWTGTQKVSRIADWPDWYPPAEMRKRKPELPEKMLGGLNNPLGAKAIYLGSTLYRIHGTNDPKSIGRAESSGCFRMLNQHVLHLASLVSVGTQVSVVHSLGKAPAKVAARPAPAARKVAAKPQPVVKKRVTQRTWRPRPYVRRWSERPYYSDYYYDDYYR